MFRRLTQRCSDDTFSVRSSASRGSRNSRVSRNSRNSRNSQQQIDGSKNESSLFELAEMEKFDDIVRILHGSNRAELTTWLSDFGRTSGIIHSQYSTSTARSDDFTKHETPLHMIMKYRPTAAVVDILIQRLNESSTNRVSVHGICRPEDVVDSDGRTPLHIAAAEGCDLPVIQRLMQKTRKAVQTRDSQLRYPLHWACANPRGASSSRSHRRGNIMRSSSTSSKSSFFPNSSTRKTQEHDAANMLEVIAALVLAFPRAVIWHDKFGKTPLDIAKERNASEMIILLLERVIEIGVDTFVTTAEAVATQSFPSSSSQSAIKNLSVSNHANHHQPQKSKSGRQRDRPSASAATDSSIENDITALSMDAPYVFEDSSCSSHSSGSRSISVRKDADTASVNSREDVVSTQGKSFVKKKVQRSIATNVTYQSGSSSSLTSKQMVSTKVVPSSANSILNRPHPNRSQSLSKLNQDGRRTYIKDSSVISFDCRSTESAPTSSNFSHSYRSGIDVLQKPIITGSNYSCRTSKSKRQNNKYDPPSVLDDETELLLQRAEKALHLPSTINGKTVTTFGNSPNRESHSEAKMLLKDYEKISGSTMKMSTHSSDGTLATRKRLGDFILSIPIGTQGPFIAPRIKPSQELDLSMHSENHFGSSRSLQSDRSVVSDSRLLISGTGDVYKSRRKGHKVVTFQNPASSSPHSIRSSLSLSISRTEDDSEFGQEKTDDVDPWEDLRELRVFSVNPKSTDIQRAHAIKAINAAHSLKSQIKRK